MNDLMIIHVIHSLKGGVAAVALNLIKKQLSDGFCVGVAYAINGDGFQGLLESNLEMYKVTPPKYPGQNMLFGFHIHAVYQYFSKKHPDKTIIIHAHNVETVGIYGNIAGIPVLCTVHGSRGKEKNIRTFVSDYLCRSVMKKIVRQHGFVVCVSNYVKSYWDKPNRLGLRVIYNGCDKGKRGQEKHRGFNIGYIGDVSYAKGIDILLESIKLLPAEIQRETKLVMAGREKDITVSDIETFFKQNDIDIEFEFKGYIPNASDAINPQLNVFVLPSRNEGLSVCLIEAMSYGVPLIGTTAGGIPEIIENKVNGFLVNNAKQLAEKISEVYYNDQLAESLSANGLRIYKEMFTADVMYRKYFELYSELCSDIEKE